MVNFYFGGCRNEIFPLIKGTAITKFPGNSLGKKIYLFEYKRG
jgi:hypothetical protein